MLIADSHCHAWRRWPYDLTVPDPGHRGSIEALLWQMDACEVERAVVVCARIGGGRGGDGHPNEDNNDYVAAAARRHPDRLIAWVDVDCVWRPEHHTAGAACRLTEELDRTGAAGITHYVGEHDDGWLRSREGEEFFAVAAERDVVVSLAAGAEWLPDVVGLARAHPTLVLLLHHLTQPRPDARREADLAAALACAAVPNIGVKVSGFHYAAERPWDYPYPRSLPLLTRLHAAFGADRLLWGSDFPAARELLTYRQSIEVVRQHSELSEEDLNRVLGGTLLHLLDTGRLPSMAAEPETRH